jgi:hypothetical protein
LLSNASECSIGAAVPYTIDSNDAVDQVTLSGRLNYDTIAAMLQEPDAWSSRRAW